MTCTHALERKIRDFTENIAPRALQQNALPQKVTERKTPGSVGKFILPSSGDHVDDCARNCATLVPKQAPENAESASHIRFGAFASFSSRAERARFTAMKLHPEQFRQLPLSEAAPLWLKEHSRYIKPRTAKDYQQYISALLSLIPDAQLCDIHIGTIRQYQEDRATKAGNARINMECSALQQILKEGDVWPELAKLYRPLPVSHRGSGRSITREDEDTLLEIAFSRPRWRLAAHCIRIMIRGGFGPGELFRVRRRDVDLKQGTVEITEGAKNPERERRVPLPPTALESLNWVMERWTGLGGEGLDDYILPHCSAWKNGPRDFSRHQQGIRRAFSGIKKEAVKQIGPHMDKFRIYDCRVTAVTKALKSGKVSIHTAKKLFGHVSEEMQRRYYKPQIDELREAAKVLEEPA